MKLTLLAAAFSLCLGCQVSRPSSEPRPPAAGEPGSQVAPPRSLEDIVRLYQQQAGVSLTYDDATAALLAAIPVTALDPAGVQAAHPVLLIGHPPADVLADAGAGQYHLLPLRHAEAGEVAAVLEGLVADASRPGTPPARIVPDVRTNSLLVAASPERVAQLEALVAQLDKLQPSADLPD